MTWVHFLVYGCKAPSMAEAVWDVQEDLLEFSRIRKA